MLDLIEFIADFFNLGGYLGSKKETRHISPEQKKKDKKQLFITILAVFLVFAVGIFALDYLASRR